MRCRCGGLELADTTVSLLEPEGPVEVGPFVFGGDGRVHSARTCDETDYLTFRTAHIAAARAVVVATGIAVR